MGVIAIFSIFADVPEKVPPPVSMVHYPSVDWSQVYVCNLANIPTPTTFVILRCSADSIQLLRQDEEDGISWLRVQILKSTPLVNSQANID